MELQFRPVVISFIFQLRIVTVQSKAVTLQRRFVQRL